MPKRVITGVNADKALEVSWVNRGSNPHAKTILRKSADQPENQTMKTAVLKSILLAGGAAAAFLDTLPDDAATNAFLEKSEADRAAEVDAWATKTNFGKAAKPKADDGDADDKMADKIAKAVADAVGAATAPLAKQVADLSTKLETVEKAGVATSIEKRAATEFKGVPNAAEILKGLEGVDAETRERVESMMKSQAEMARLTSVTVGHDRLAKDANSATAKLDTLAKAHAEAKGISLERAVYEVQNDPANAALVEKADAEQMDNRVED